MNIFRYNFILSIALLMLVFITGCATPNSDPEDPNKYIFPELEEVTSIREFDIDSWTEVDRRSLIVNTSPSKSYLIILRKPNNDLRFAHAISFGKEGRIYSKFDRIHIINNSSGLEPLPALIERIYKLNGNDQKKKVISKLRDKEKVEENKKKTEGLNNKLNKID